MLKFVNHLGGFAGDQGGKTSKLLIGNRGGFWMTYGKVISAVPMIRRSRRWLGPARVIG